MCHGCEQVFLFILERVLCRVYFHVTCIYTRVCEVLKTFIRTLFKYFEQTDENIREKYNSKQIINKHDISIGNDIKARRSFLSPFPL